MGLIFSGFRHTRMIDEDLEVLDSTIKYTENQEQCMKKKQKKILRSIDVTMCLLVLFAFVLYSVIGPGGETTWGGSVFHATLLIIGMFIFIVMIRQLLSLYYKRKLEHLQTKIRAMKVEKKTLLEEVKTESYKAAKEILDRYDSD